MRFSTAFFATFAFVLSALAAPSALVNVVKAPDETNGRYIVTLKPGSSQSALLEATPGANAIYQYDIINAVAGEFTNDHIEQLRANPDVESIHEDSVSHTYDTFTQTNAPWGLARLSSIDKLENQDTSDLNFEYTYDTAAGEGVDIYVVDTGVYIEHVEFEGRARWGATFGGYPDVDDNGHGTHCAGTAASAAYGVAKKVSIIAVKVLGSGGRGYNSDIISGLDFVLNSAQTSGQPSIASLSLGSRAYTPLDDAVATLTNNGIHVIAAAGNDHKDAHDVSPARAPSAVTVAASNISDGQAWFSNYGSVVDIFAPGEDIISTWIDSPTATKTLSGTSMAAPHISGLVAYFISIYGNDTPQAYQDYLKQIALKDVVDPISPNTINDLAQNGLAAV